MVVTWGLSAHACPLAAIALDWAIEACLHPCAARHRYRWPCLPRSSPPLAASSRPASSAGERGGGEWGGAAPACLATRAEGNCKPMHGRPGAPVRPLMLHACLPVVALTAGAFHCIHSIPAASRSRTLGTLSPATAASQIASTARWVVGPAHTVAGGSCGRYLAAQRSQSVAQLC